MTMKTKMKTTMKMEKGQQKTPSTSRRLSRVQNEASMSLAKGMRLVTRRRRKVSPRRLGCNLAFSEHPK